MTKSTDTFAATLQGYLDRKIPTNWELYDLNNRRKYYSLPNLNDYVDSELKDRELFSPIEFIRERMRRDEPADRLLHFARRINQVMRGLPDWEILSNSRHCEKLYGIQRGYRKKVDFAGVLSSDQAGE
ncbi:MAG: hypothetical protein SNG38_08340 [Rikenellaceae bacterium]